MTSSEALEDLAGHAIDESLSRWLLASSSGCNTSFALLYKYTRARVLGIVLRVVHHRGEAEEVLQEVYVKIWARSVQFDAGRGLVMSWLAGIAHHAAIDARRRDARRPLESSDATGDHDAYNGLASTEDGPAEVCERSQIRSLVREQLRFLPIDQQQSLSMAFMDGLTHQEIALKLACPLGTIKSRVRRALMSMRDPLHALQ